MKLKVQINRGGKVILIIFVLLCHQQLDIRNRKRKNRVGTYLPYINKLSHLSSMFTCMGVPTLRPRLKILFLFDLFAPS